MSFFDPKADLELSDTARHFIAGIVKHATSFYSDHKSNCKFL